MVMIMNRLKKNDLKLGELIIQGGKCLKKDYLFFNSEELFLFFGDFIQFFKPKPYRNNVGFFIPATNDRK